MRKLLLVAVLLGCLAPTTVSAGGVWQYWDAWADWYERKGDTYVWSSVYVHESQDGNGGGTSRVNLKKGRCKEIEGGGFLCVPKIENGKALQEKQFQVAEDLSRASLRVRMWGDLQRVRWVSDGSAPYSTGFDRYCEREPIPEHGEGVGRHSLAKGTILGDRVYTRGNRDEAYLEYFLSADPCEV